MSDANDALAKAIRDADMGELLPKLLKVATRVLRRRSWAGGRDHQPSPLEAQELVNETMTRIFDEDQQPAFDGDIVKAMAIGMASVATSTAKKLRKVSLTGDVEEAEQPSGETGDGEILAAVWALAKQTGDAEVEEYLIGLEYYGPKREDIAAGLDWAPAKVSVVFKKLKRLIDRNNLQVPRRKAASNE